MRKNIVLIVFILLTSIGLKSTHAQVVFSAHASVGILSPFLPLPVIYQPAQPVRYYSQDPYYYSSGNCGGGNMMIVNNNYSNQTYYKQSYRKQPKVYYGNRNRNRKVKY